MLARPGQIIADRYRLEQPLGHGAMGRIWRAEHLALSSKVALKFLHQTIADSPEAFNRFMLEAQSAAAVRCAHVVQILDCGVDGPMPYICMELLHGESLDQRLRARITLRAHELDKILREVALAVDNAHLSGVIHRDLKPGNIFIAREREREITKVLDFGIAKLIDPCSDRDSAGITSSGVLLGTPHYMSPEQARGNRRLDHRTDLWSLAVIAYECMTGELPFQGGSMGDIFVQICKEQPLPPSEIADVPPGFDEWFRKGTSKEPAERFASAGEMAAALSRILLDPHDPQGRPPGRASNTETLRSEPGCGHEEPRSSTPVVRATSVWLPPSRVRWLFLGAVAALASSVVAIAFEYPSGGSRHFGSSGRPGTPAPPSITAPSTSEQPAPSRAVRDPDLAPPPPSSAAEPTLDELPNPARAMTKTLPLRRPAAPRARAQNAEPAPARKDPRTAPAPHGSESPAQQPPAIESVTAPAARDAVEPDEADPFSERR